MTPSARTSRRTLASIRSVSNSGEGRPMTRSPAALYRRSSDATHGSERRQLIQPYVQTSIKTTRPLSSENERGDKLIHICGSRVGKSGAIGSRGSTEPADERYLAASTMPQISARTDIPARKGRNRLTIRSTHRSLVLLPGARLWWRRSRLRPDGESNPCGGNPIVPEGSQYTLGARHEE